MKKPIAIGVALAIVVVLGLWWFVERANNSDDGLVLLGNVDIRQVSLAFNGSGRVLQVLVEEGDQVRAGDVLASLDVQPLALQAAQARALIEVQQQAVVRLRNGSRPEEIAQASSGLTAARADAERAAQDLRRFESVSTATQGQGISAQELDRARAVARMAASAAEQQRLQFELVQQGPRKEDVAGAEAQLKASKAHLELLEYQIAQGQLKAPIDSTVRSRLVEVGDMVTPQRPAFALALTHPKWVRVFASETELGRIRPGMAAQVSTDSRPVQPIKGRVVFISPVAEFTPKSVQTEELRTSLVYEVRILAEDTADQLRLGQPVTVRLVSDVPR